jgi:DegV family protein with EDD domain
MGDTIIVTDSTAELSTKTVEQLGITVVPWRLLVGSQTLSDGPKVRTASFHKELIRKRVTPAALPPTSRQFASAYGSLAKRTDDIVSIHSSSQFTKTVQSATQGRTNLLGRCQIHVVDSQFVSWALGVLVVEAAKAAQQGASGLEIVRLVHGMIAHTYLAFYVDSTEYLRRSGLMRTARQKMGPSPSFRPLILLEEGEFAPLYRSRGRGTPTERLVEFVIEFQELKRIAILHTGLRPGISELQTQLSEALGNQELEEHIYSPVLGTYIGPKAQGIAIVEG